MIFDVNHFMYFKKNTKLLNRTMVVTLTVDWKVVNAIFIFSAAAKESP